MAFRDVWRLILALVLVGGTFMVPTGYQMTNVNIPQPEFEIWTAKVSGTDDPQSVQVVALWSLIVTVRLLGNVLGAIISSPLSDILGRRNALWLISIPMILGDLLAFTTKYSNSYIQLIIGRLLSGIADGAQWNCLVVFFTEVSPARLRGRIGASIMILREVGMLLGILLGFPQALGTYDNMFYIFLVSLIMELLIPAIMPFFPESPRYLFIKRGQRDKAIESLKFYQGDNTDFRSVLANFQRAADDIANAPSLRETAKTKEFKYATLIAVCFGSSFGFAGRFVLLNYSANLIRQAGFSRHHASVSALIIQFLPIPTGLLDIPIVDRFGRRPIFIIASALTLALELLIFILFQVQKAHYTDVTSYIIVILIGAWEPIMIGGLMCLHFVPSECFANNTRAIGFSIHTFCWFLIGGLTTQVFNVIQAKAMGYGILFLFLPFFVIAIFLMLFLPETKGRSVEAIARDIKNLRIHLPWIKGETFDDEEDEYGQGIPANLELTESETPSEQTPLVAKRRSLRRKSSMGSGLSYPAPDDSHIY